MKTKFATIIATAALVLSSITLTYADGATFNGTSTDLKSVGKINSIEATGNVDVYIMNGDYDAVKVYSDYYGENAIVRNDKGVLQISSYDTDKLVVLVTVSDLHAISASENAFVKTYNGPLYAKSLTVQLSDSAVGVLNLDVTAADINVKNQAHAELAGTVENFNLAYAATATVSETQLRSLASRVKKVEQPKVIAMLADLGSNALLLN